MGRLELGSQLRSAGFSATWAAGMCWFVLALVSAPAALGFTLLILTAPMGIALGVLGVALPLSLVSGLWGYRSRMAAVASILYSLALASLFMVPAATIPAPALLLPAALLASPGIISVLAFRELGSGLIPPRGTV